MKNFSRIYQNLRLPAKPGSESREEIIKDIKLLNWQVRPLKGDITRLMEDQDAILEMIWKLMKLTRRECWPERIFMVKASLKETDLAFELVPKQLFEKNNLN